MNDPLNINIALEGVETSIPLIPEGDYVLQITESTVEPNKRQDGHNWNLKLATTSPITAVDGREIQPNFPVYNLVALQPGPDSKDPEAFRRNISDTVDAIFGSDKTNRPAFNRALWESAVGKSVLAHIYVDSYEGRQSNKIKRMKKVA